jgi:hypothetical protein
MIKAEIYNGLGGGIMESYQSIIMQCQLMDLFDDVDEFFEDIDDIDDMEAADFAAGGKE